MDVTLVWCAVWPRCTYGSVGYPPVGVAADETVIQVYIFFFCSFSMRACWWELELLAVRQYFIIEAASHTFQLFGIVKRCCSSTVQLIMIVSHRCNKCEVPIAGCPSNKCICIGRAGGGRVCSHISIIKRIPKKINNLECFRTYEKCLIYMSPLFTSEPIVWCAIWTRRAEILR
jgi:hypothetical protein